MCAFSHFPKAPILAHSRSYYTPFGCHLFHSLFLTISRFGSNLTNLYPTFSCPTDWQSTSCPFGDARRLTSALPLSFLHLTSACAYYHIRFHSQTVYLLSSLSPRAITLALSYSHCGPLMRCCGTLFSKSSSTSVLLAWWLSSSWSSLAQFLPPHQQQKQQQQRGKSGKA